MNSINRPRQDNVARQNYATEIPKIFIIIIAGDIQATFVASVCERRAPNS